MTTPPARRLPARPDLAQLRRQAKELRQRFLAGDTETRTLVAALDAEPVPDDLPLHRAQLVVARSYGFDSWPKLKAFVDGATVARLIAAVRAGDVEAARSMLDRRPELVNTDLAENNEHRPIHYAVLDRKPEMVRLLIERGADARQGIHPHREPTSALTLATDRGYDEIVAVIEDGERRRSEGAEPEPRRPGGVELFDQPMPLTDAVRADDLERLTEMLAGGADPDEPTRLANLDEAVYSSGSPLWTCAISGKHEMARLLLEHGADPDAMVYAGGTPVFQAYGQRDRRMVELLEQYGGKPDAATLGHYRRTEQARAMLEEADRGILPEGFDSSAALVEELLWCSACGGDPEIVRLSLARTTWEPDDPRWYRILEQPLRMWHHMGTFWENEDFDRTTYLTCFELLLARCDPDVEGRYGMRILHDLAAARAHVADADQIRFATALLDAGAGFTARDDLLRSTPLGWACRWGRTSLVELLIERGADPTEADGEPWARPRAWAEKRGHAGVVAVLDAHDRGR